jgi:hypothetical protein
VTHMDPLLYKKLDWELTHGQDLLHHEAAQAADCEQVRGRAGRGERGRSRAVCHPRSQHAHHSADVGADSPFVCSTTTTPLFASFLLPSHTPAQLLSCPLVSHMYVSLSYPCRVSSSRTRWAWSTSATTSCPC